MKSICELKAEYNQQHPAPVMPKRVYKNKADGTLTPAFLKYSSDLPAYEINMWAFINPIIDAQVAAAFVRRFTEEETEWLDEEEDGVDQEC